MMSNFFLIGIFSVFLSTVSQILLKISANKKWGLRTREYFNIYVICGYGILFFCLMLTIYVYTGLDLKFGAVLESFGYIFIMILSSIFLKERITKNKLIGNIIIIIGILIFNLNF